jgi:hypothetical protein
MLRGVYYLKKIFIRHIHFYMVFRPFRSGLTTSEATRQSLAVKCSKTLPARCHVWQGHMPCIENFVPYATYRQVACLVSIHRILSIACYLLENQFFLEMYHFLSLGTPSIWRWSFPILECVCTVGQNASVLLVKMRLYCWSKCACIVGQNASVLLVKMRLYCWSKCVCIVGQNALQIHLSLITSPRHTLSRRFGHI